MDGPHSLGAGTASTPFGPFAEYLRGHGLRTPEQVRHVRERTWALRLEREGLPELTFANRPIVSMLDRVRFYGEPHAGLDAWRRGEELAFDKPDWELARES
jgi:hypothetical protein